ncbi:MAG: peptidylprolyl isomerase [Anaerolineales bacterium]|jgi:cyclophilin family peptidyl-prolyl cis-trans isomerase/protein-disulfide isomerase|uniref:peptidylprolyl isomerase n=1 Tax=Candidatus Villigracilis vicinus TaxID=3140679 RepID=UPI00313553A5|nr:peptidylprolyl isomerase [Anaerolineales bacterium]MBK7448717.1 peptidylprolyl isomerase [Anaerolineales bacterium]MBK9782715.1 peptidylprolyl isomerase [Anaerolineales bacterium]
MKKILYGLLLLCAAIFLTACASSQEAPPTPALVSNPVLPVTATPQFTCKVIEAIPTPLPNEQTLVPLITEADYSIGPTDAPVTILEYCDFQSQGCLAVAQTIAELMRHYTGGIRFVFRPMPLTDALDKSDDAILAAFAAEEQGKFWEMYDLLFVNNLEWSNMSPGEFKAWLLRTAPSAGIDVDQLTAAMNADEAQNKLKAAQEAVAQLPIQTAPLVFINGSLQQYFLDYKSLSETVGLIMLGQKQFSDCPPFDVDASKQYIATLETEKGNIVLQLFPDKAPFAVNSFIFLARQGWYDGVTFHRVIPGFVAQAGDPSGTGRGNPGYFFVNELSDLTFTRPGMVGMANSGPDTNGSQFFITYAPVSHLNKNYTIFGQVINGQDVAENLTPRDPSQGGYLPAGDMILHVSIEEK